MTATDHHRAQNVCHACMTRKKACDKTLPSCGSCIQRHLQCNYDPLFLHGKGRRRYNPGRNFVSVGYLSPHNINLQPGNVINDHPHPSSQELVDHFTKLFELTVEDVVDQYLQSYHPWLPIISPATLHQEVTAHRHGKRPLTQHTHVLLLAMMLNISPVLNAPCAPAQEAGRQIYEATKTAYAQAQTPGRTSIRLVQAGYLIALREYTSVRPEAAYVSIMTCIGMARMIGIGSVMERQSERSTRPDDHLWAEHKDRLNLTWAMALLERLILGELNRSDLIPVTALPRNQPQSSRLPTPPSEPVSSQIRVRSCFDAVGEEPNHSHRMMELIELFDRLLSLTRVESTEIEFKVAQLAILDKEIRGFLEMIISELEETQRLLCNLVALCVRSLFHLHTSILTILANSNSNSSTTSCSLTTSTNQPARELSLAALDMVCRMVLEVVDLVRTDKLIVVPIGRFYTLRNAREHLEWLRQCRGAEVLSTDIESLRFAEVEYLKNWEIA